MAFDRLLLHVVEPKVTQLSLSEELVMSNWLLQAEPLLLEVGVVVRPFKL